MNTHYSIDKFVQENNLKKGDVVIARRNMLGILDHYIVYLGVDDWGQHQFIANLAPEVRYLSEEEIEFLLKDYTPYRIRRFEGSDWERFQAEDRAIGQLGKQYDLIDQNCEHFANYVQKGKAYSQQTKNAKNAALGIAGLALLAVLLKND